LFNETDAFSIMLSQVERMPAPPLQINPALPPTLNEIILIALAKNPADRFQSADAFHSELKRVNQVVNGSSRYNGSNGKSRQTSKRFSANGSAADWHATEARGAHIQVADPPEEGNEEAAPS